MGKELLRYRPTPKPEKKPYCARPHRSSHNSNGFTTDEAQTATLILTEGSPFCFKETKRGKQYRYPSIHIGMCDKEALQPASRALNATISSIKRTAQVCPPELFPPDGKGFHEMRIYGKKAKTTVQKLSPLLTQHFKNKWQKLLQTCK